MRTSRCLLFCALFLGGCSRSPVGAPPEPALTAPTTPAPRPGSPGETAARSDPDDARSRVRLAGPDEPGQRLTVTGVLVRADDRSPLPGHRFRVYQADASGDYRATNPADERTARLAADVTTDRAGRFEISTILPGVYGTPPGDPHLHLEVRGAEPGAHVVYFEGFLQEDTRRWQKTTAQAHIVQVTRGADGVIAGDFALPVHGVAR